MVPVRKRKAELAAAGLLAAAVTAAINPQSQAAQVYSTAGVTLTENFDSLPNAKPSGELLSAGSNLVTMQASNGGGYTTGWVNDTDYLSTPDALDIGVRGVHLWHFTFQSSPNSMANTGPSGHARFNQGGGSTAAPGGFVGFVSGVSPFTNGYSDKALGSITTYAISTTTGGGFYTGNTNLPGGGRPLRIGYEIVNNTGAPLTEFTLTYDGEQYMDGRAADPDSLTFSYSLDESASSYNTETGPAGTYVAVPALDFVAPNVNDYTNATGSSSTNAIVVDGNDPIHRVANISATVSGIEWLPGQSLFLNWTDTPLANGTNDGLGIDNIRFVAVPEPTGLAVLTLGAAAGLARRRRHGRRQG